MVINIGSSTHNVGATVLGYLLGEFLKKEKTLIICVSYNNTLSNFLGLPNFKFRSISTVNSSLRTAINLGSFQPSIFFQELDGSTVADKNLFYYNLNLDLSLDSNYLREFTDLLENVDKLFRYVIVDVENNINAYTNFSPYLDRIIFALPPDKSKIIKASEDLETHKLDYLRTNGVSMKAVIIPVICKMDKTVLNSASIFSKGDNKLGKILHFNYFPSIIKACNDGKLNTFANKLLSVSQARDTIILKKQLEVIHTEGGRFI